MLIQNRFHRLNGGHNLPVSCNIVVVQSVHGAQSLLSLGGVPAELDECHLSNKLFKHVEPVSSSAAATVWFDELTAVVVIERDLLFERRLPLDRAFHSATPAMPEPDAIVEPKLHFLLDIPWEIVGRDPTGVNIEGPFATVRIMVYQLQLDGVPGVARRRADQAALAGSRHRPESAAERKVDQFDIVHGHVSAGVAPLNPLGKLLPRYLLWLQQRTVAAVDVLQLLVDHERT